MGMVDSVEGSCRGSGGGGNLEGSIAYEISREEDEELKALFSESSSNSNTIFWEFRISQRIICLNVVLYVYVSTCASEICWWSVAHIVLFLECECFYYVLFFL